MHTTGQWMRHDDRSLHTTGQWMRHDGQQQHAPLCIAPLRTTHRAPFPRALDPIRDRTVTLSR